MTREDTIKVLAILKAAFPASYRNITRDEANGVVMIWATQFANDPAEVVIMAIQKLIATSTFPPSISEVKSMMRNMYWEAWQSIQMNENGCIPLEPMKLEATKAVLNACEKYHRSGSNEPMLDELINGSGELKNYLTEG